MWLNGGRLSGIVIKIPLQKLSMVYFIKRCSVRNFRQFYETNQMIEALMNVNSFSITGFQKTGTWLLLVKLGFVRYFHWLAPSSEGSETEKKT